MGEPGAYAVERGAHSAARDVDGAQARAIGDTNLATDSADAHIARFLAVSQCYLRLDLTPPHPQRPTPSPKMPRPRLVRLGIGRAWPPRKHAIVNAPPQRVVRLPHGPSIEKKPRGVTARELAAAASRPVPTGLSSSRDGGMGGASRATRGRIIRLMGGGRK